jgi:hypothetical protein
MTREYFVGMVLRPALQLAVAAFVAIAATILFRRRRGWPTLILLVGSVAFLLFRVMDVFLLAMMPLVSEHPDSPFFAAIWPTCTPHPAFDVIGKILTVAALICLPIGLVSICIQALRRT